MKQVSEITKEATWDLFDETTACDNCWGCGWLIEELNIPFYDLTFDKLFPGDRVIRCHLCNKAPQFGAKPKLPANYEDTVC